LETYEFLDRETDLEIIYDDEKVRLYKNLNFSGNEQIKFDETGEEIMGGLSESDDITASDSSVSNENETGESVLEVPYTIEDMMRNEKIIIDVKN